MEEIGTVETFDYDYMREGRKRPDRLPQLIAAHRAALENFVDREAGVVNRTEPARSIFLIGKSMGGRIGCVTGVKTLVDDRCYRFHHGEHGSHGGVLSYRPLLTVA